MPSDTLLRRSRVSLLVLCIAAAGAIGQIAQVAAPDQAAHDGARLHRLAFTAYYLEQAEACDIPDAMSEIVRGTHVMTPARSDYHADHRAFALREINWLVTSPHGGRITDETLVTGRGLYTLGRSPEGQPLHRLVLDLRLGEEPVRFDSGLVPRQANAPLDIIVREVNDDYLCVRRFFRVASSAVSSDEVVPYAMGNTAAFEFQASSGGPLHTIAIGGGFGLIDLPVEPGTPAPGGLTEWALVRLEAMGGGHPHGEPAVGLRGAGVYQHFTATFTGEPVERLQAELTVRGTFAPPHNHPLRFDSGLTGSPWAGPTNADPLPFFHSLLEDTVPAFPLWRVHLVAGPMSPDP